MADKRRPEGRITIESPNARVAVELFPAHLFPGGEQYAGQYRVRIGRRWLRSAEERYVFLCYAEVFGWLISMSEKLMPSGDPARQDEEPRPDLKHGSRRRMLIGRADDGTALYEAVMCMTDPFQGPDGRWRVFLVGRRDPVLAISLTPDN